MKKIFLTFALASTIFSPIVSLHAADKVNVLAFAGSTREGALNKALVIEAANMAHEMGANVTYVDLKDYPMPFYDADIESKEGMPEKARLLRQLMMKSQVVLISSPEYNSSFSAVLKNALDWLSRGENGGGSRDAFRGKKFALMSISPGKGGGARGLPHLRTVIEDVGGTVMPEQVSVPQGFHAFDGHGKLVNPQAKMQLHHLVKSTLQGS